MKLFKPLLIIALLSLCACDQMKYLTVPVDYNPKLAFKPDTTTILIVNQTDLNARGFTGKKLKSLKAGAFTATKYAGIQLGQLQHVKIINLVDSALFNTNADSIKTLATKYHSDYILALNNFSADISMSALDNASAYYSSSVEVDFTLYIGENGLSKKLRGISNAPQPQNLYLGFVASLVIRPTVGNSKGSIVSSAEEATQMALQEYLPYTETYVRPVYNNKPLQPAVAEIFANHFDKAYTLLEPFLKNADPVLASKAAYNLAVVYEAQGDVDIAIEMAQQSLDKNKNDLAASLLTQLKQE